ncbi:hypothetical protein [Actinoplanes sp. NPDC049316]|uniref:hypothetical protein n=1 Tax=Actinoplanes sp. NPDC049316 TaxID=3154727 RepID=UPI00342E047E
MPRARHITHERRRLFFRPWRATCRCGLGAWPCPAARAPLPATDPAPPAGGSAAWDTRTQQLPQVTRERPLLTPGQVWRSQKGARR